jgi:hypothetical protein
LIIYKKLCPIGLPIFENDITDHTLQSQEILNRPVFVLDILKSVWKLLKILKRFWTLLKILNRFWKFWIDSEHYYNSLQVDISHYSLSHRQQFTGRHITLLIITQTTVYR